MAGDPGQREHEGVALLRTQLVTAWCRCQSGVWQARTCEAGYSLVKTLPLVPLQCFASTLRHKAQQRRL
jgi:hypothetical protein